MKINYPFLRSIISRGVFKIIGLCYLLGMIILACIPFSGGHELFGNHFVNYTAADYFKQGIIFGFMATACYIEAKDIELPKFSKAIRFVYLPSAIMLTGLLAFAVYHFSSQLNLPIHFWLSTFYGGSLGMVLAGIFFFKLFPK